MSTPTTNFAMTKPATTDGVSGLRTAIGDNADLLDVLILNHLKVYRQVVERTGQMGGGSVAAGTFVIPQYEAGAILAAGAITCFAPRAFYVDLADYAVAGRTTKYRVRAEVVTNTVASGITWTAGLYPVATFAGAGGANAIVNSLSAVVAGSTAAIATPGASAGGQNNSGDFTPPAAGWYVLAVVTSGTTAASSQSNIRAALQVRNV